MTVISVPTNTRDVEHLMYREIAQLFDENEKREPEQIRENVRLLAEIVSLGYER